MGALSCPSNSSIGSLPSRVPPVPGVGFDTKNTGVQPLIIRRMKGVMIIARALASDGSRRSSPFRS